MKNRVFLLACLALIGCSDSGRPKIEDSSSSPDDGQQMPEGPGFDLDRSAKSVLGPWLFYSAEGHQEVLYMQVFFGPNKDADPDKIAMALNPAPDQKDAHFKPLTFTISETEADFTFSINDNKLNFRGVLRDGIIWGNMAGGGQCGQARLIRPAKTEHLEPPPPHNAEGVNDFAAVFNKKLSWKSLAEFAKEHPDSPLTSETFRAMVPLCRLRNLSAEKTRQFLDDATESARVWGNRYADFFRLQLLVELAGLFHQPNLVAAETDSLRSTFSGDEWKTGPVAEMFAMIDDVNPVSAQIDEITSADAARLAEIKAGLERDERKRVMNPYYLYLVADRFEKAGDDEAAIRYFGRMCSVPQIDSLYLAQVGRYDVEVVPPMDRLKAVWTRVHGNDDGLEAFRLNAYREYLASLAPEADESASADANPVLVELFTGTGCGPCAGVDMAFDVLRRFYADRPVSFVQYHVNVPLPDPMANSDTEKHFFRCEALGTPFLYINGTQVENLQVMPVNVRASVARLKSEIDRELAYKPDLTIELTAAPAEGRKVRCSAKVSAADGVGERARLFLVLTEREIQYRALNGVPFHEEVARKILGGSEGVAPSGGAIQFEAEIDLDRLKSSLEGEIETLQKEDDVRFDKVPLELKDLSLVAFVRDTRSRRVLCSTSIPVKGVAAETQVSAAD